VQYETPRITDFGSIGQQALIPPSGDDEEHIDPPLDPVFGEYSSGEHS